MRFSSLVSICSYSSFRDDSEEIVDVGVVDGPTDESDEEEDGGISTAAVVAVDADT